jgi:predicted metal-dependent phosphoesterase TrpH
MFADLHLHTLFSDGTYTPDELAGYARHHGLTAVAITDHDSMEGCDWMATACARNGLEFVPGVELTAELQGYELHLLGYYLDRTQPALVRALSRFQVVRQNRIREIVTRLNALQIPLRADAVFALANCHSPGRPHVARAMVEAGFVRSLDEAFERFLKRHRAAWVPKFKMSAAEAVNLIHAAGGLAVMAHPGLSRTDQLIPPLVEAGLDGLECFHAKHSTATTEHYLVLAEHHGLLVTGGSDCHGLSKGKPLIGTVKLPYDYFARFKAALNRSRTAV